MGTAAKRAAIAAAAALLACTLSGASAAHADHSVTELVSIGPAGGNAAFSAGNMEISRDGSHAYFTTAERLVAADTDAQGDLYVRTGGTTSLVSTGPTGGNGSHPVAASLPRGISADGTRAIFRTAERLVPEDTDEQVDVYERAGGATTLVSVGPAGGNGAFDVDATAVMSLNGAAIAFITAERLTSDDTNDVRDVYLRAGGQTVLVSGGPDGPAGPLFVIALSSDGTRVFFSTSRRLSPNDTDFLDDAYKWEAGQLTQETVGPNGENGDANAHNEMIDEAGSRLFFKNADPFFPRAGVDTIYERAGGTTRMVSVTSTGEPRGGFLMGITPDGSHAYFLSRQQLVPEDTDVVDDLYVRANGETRLVSAGPLAVNEDFQTLRFGGASRDGSRAFFATFERLTPEDTDGGYSAYEYSGGTSARYLAPASAVTPIAGHSADGERVFVVTGQSLVPADTDAEADVYEIRGSEPTLISTGPTDPQQGSVCETIIDFRISTSCPFSTSEDGTRVLFRSNAPLVAADTDSSYDVYLARTNPEPVRADYRNGPAYCRALRDFLGEEAFTERYGTGANAFGKCVSGGGTKQASK